MKSLPRFIPNLLAACALLHLAPSARCAESPVSTTPWQDLGGDTFDGWSGLTVGRNTATLKSGGEAVWTHPDGPFGLHKQGFRMVTDSASDWHGFYGLTFEARLDDKESADLKVTLTPSGREGLGKSTSAQIALQGKGWHTVTLPWSAFDTPSAKSEYLLAVKEVKIALVNPETSSIEIRQVRAIEAPVIALKSDVLGKSAKAGDTAEYTVNVSNATRQPQSVVLSFAKYGWEAMQAKVEPEKISLAPGETKAAKVSIEVPANVPPGGHEHQTLLAIGNGDAANASKLTFATACELPHPYILHTPGRWSEVREKVRKFAWAKAAQKEITDRADKWQVPEIAKPPANDPDDTYGPFVFPTTSEHDMMAAGIAWQLTRNKEYAAKAAEYLRRLSDPAKGYPTTFRACNQSLVQEGHYFQHMAMVYDMISDAGVLSNADRTQIEATFRLLLETLDRANLNSSINNGNVSELTGALYCALALQDLSAAERFFSGPGAICDQLAKGTMDDGWWYECAISYNTWVASEFSQAALALQPWGWNFKDAWLPANYTPSAMLTNTLSGGSTVATGQDQNPNRPFGMSSEISGPMRRPARTITDLWNSLLPFIDYRGVMFAVNDSAEMRVAGSRPEVGGQPFEMAYYLFRDPAYASLVKLGGSRDLLYGVPDLPEKTPERFRDSAYADNVGLVMLRSQTENRPIREQIQAVLHYGTHGWAHGHYDRTSLLHLSRYGRSFFNPEMIWYGYEPFMYKFYVQTSIAKNMVVVDHKMQEATPGKRILFHTGKLMQAAAVEATARWSYPPYGGMVYDYVPVKTFEEKTWREGRYVPIPKDPPAYGTLTGYTEPILQRRAMIVTDDYVVLADYVKGDKPHIFENLFQMKGFQGLEASDKKLLRHDAQWDPDPVNAAQFITDCNWYSAQAPALARFEMRFGKNADNAGTRAVASEDGILKQDVYSLWPKQQEIMVGTAPEEHGTQKRLFYTVRGDGQTLAEGKFGAWILGQADLDIPLKGVTKLELETKVEISKNPTVFWGNARIVTMDGREIPLSELHPKFQNVVLPKTPNKDYQDGPVKIVGLEQKTSEPGQPRDEAQPAVITIDLAGQDAARFKATLGSDYPLGPEAQRRKTYAIRPPEKAGHARFLSIIEPYEDKSVIKSAAALSENKLRVELKDGRVQEIEIQGLAEGEKDLFINMVESRNGTIIRTENTATSGPVAK